MATFKDQYTQAVSSGLSAILSVITSYYEEEHGVQVSVDELMALLDAKVPSSAKIATKTTTATKTAAAKTTTRTAATKTTTKTAAKPDKERRERDEGQLPGLCLYVLTRGVNDGKYCTVKAAKGSNTCTSCAKKKGQLGFYADEVDQNDVDGGRAPGKFTGAVPEDGESPTFSITPYGDSSVVYVTEEGSPTLLVVINEEDEDDYIVIGQMSPKGKVMPLNKMGMKRAQALELEINTDMLAELQEKGIIEKSADDSPSKSEPADDIDSVPGVNTGNKTPKSSKPNIPTRKPGISSTGKPLPKRTPATRPVRAAIEVEDDEEVE